MPDLLPFQGSSGDLLRLVVEAGNIGIWKLDLDTGHAWRNRRHDEIFGYHEPVAEWTYDMFLDHVVEEDRSEVDELQRGAIMKGHEWQFECRIVRSDGVRRWISASGRPLFGEDGQVETLIGHVIDISATKAREERLSLVTQELNHRVRNMLATIRAMIGFTAKGSSDISDFAQALGGRIDALARTHEVLVGESSETLSPAEILERELDAFPGLNERVEIIAKQEITLPLPIVQPVALILHELITNAIKYGAFSSDEGSVLVHLSVEGDEIRLVWEERGGPEVTGPERKGFGSRLISGALGKSGAVRTDFLTTGIRTVITIFDRENASSVE